MKRTFGSRQETKPAGMLRPLFFPALAFMDVKTSDGRLLKSAGGGTRDLPQSIWGQFVQGEGHSGAVVIGALHEVTMDEDGVVSGSGWALDDDNGKTAVRYLETQAMRGNSVDLADTAAEFEWDAETDEMSIVFNEWNIAGTTLVGRPAFGQAHASLTDELMASWYSSDAPLVIDIPATINVMAVEREIVASGTKAPSWDLFHQAEAEIPHKLFPGEPNENGYIPVSGHLAMWNSCHEAYADCMIVPRPQDNYAGFNGPGVLTDRGIVATGPIFAIGGHPKAGELQKKSVDECYGGIENAWADVKVIPGVHGPWASGYVRPGTDEATIIAARASKVSGHWVGSALKAIVSVNVPGYEVKSGDSFALAEDGTVLELVASFSCPDSEAEIETETDDETTYATEDLRMMLEKQDLVLE